MSNQSRQPRRTYRTLFLVAAGVFLVMGLLVGLVPTKPGAFSHVECGSVLGGASSTEGCVSAMATSTTWMWLFLLGFFMFFVAAFVLDLLQRIAHALTVQNAQTP